MALVLALFSVALTLAQMGLPAVGYELSPEQGRILLTLATLFGVGALVALLWTWVGPLVNEIRRVRFRWPFALAPTKTIVSPELESLRAERDTLKKEVTYWENRRLLVRALENTYLDGVQLRQGHYDEDVIKGWEKRTSKLIEEALGLGEMLLFVAAPKDGTTIDPNATEQQIRVDIRLDRLHGLIGRANSVKSLKLQPGFDGREWVSEK